MKRNDENMLVALDKAVSDTFEQMAFMEVCPLPETEGTGVDGFRWVRIHVGHPLEVELRMGCPVALLSEVSETVFSGMEFPEGVDALGDALAELANMIAGSLLSHLFPDDSAVSVGVPEPTEAQRNGRAVDEGLSRLYGFDDGRQLRLSIARQT